MSENVMELCDRLRHLASYRMPIPHEAIKEAADLIERQEAKIKRQEIEYLALQNMCDIHVRYISHLEKVVLEWREDFQSLSVNLAEMRSERDTLRQALLPKEE